jgi:hypothetical protein
MDLAIIFMCFEGKVLLSFDMVLTIDLGIKFMVLRGWFCLKKFGSKKSHFSSPFLSTSNLLFSKKHFNLRIGYS